MREQCMQADKIQTLNSNYAIGEHITFVAGPGGLTVAEIRNAHASASVALQGGHVVAFQPHGHAPVLWLSSRSVYAIGKAIRGGIPVCWPWFGPHPTDPTKPAHGFVRTAMWSVRGTGVGPEDATQLWLGLSDDEATRALWPHAFNLEIAITVGPALQVDLVARNTGAAAFTCGGALHSYFAISEVTAIAIDGLD